MWITGFSGSGKTTVARLVCARLRRAGRPVALLDGDALRRAIAVDLGYAMADRRQCAERYARLARLLATQGLVVVVATISMFEDVRRWNRRGAPRYVEVFLRVPVVARRARLRACRRRVPVVDDEAVYQEPRRPDLVVDDPALTAAEVAARVWRCVVAAT